MNSLQEVGTNHLSWLLSCLCLRQLLAHTSQKSTSLINSRKIISSSLKCVFLYLCESLKFAGVVFFCTLKLTDTHENVQISSQAMLRKADSFSSGERQREKTKRGASLCRTRKCKNCKRFHDRIQHSISVHDDFRDVFTNIRSALFPSCPHVCPPSRLLGSSSVLSSMNGLEQRFCLLPKASCVLLQSPEC